MNCPRCDSSTYADRLYCPSCHWQLSRPFTAGATPPIFSSNGALESRAPVPSAPDPFILTPPRRAEWMNRPQRRRGFARHHRHQPPTNGNAVAVLPAEARWEAPPRLEVLEMPVVQSSFDFTAAEQEAQQLAARAAAPVGVRFQAGLFDAMLILLASGVFFGLFAVLGGPPQAGFARRDLLIYLLAGYSLAILYFGLFTLLGGRTPGMHQHRLRVVSFEGKPLARTQALWRAFGYVVSTGSLLLGFFWALADERRLTWHDHMSQTFTTDRTVL
jgi:uncharacterized RDD family membrane protein YckC